MAEVIPQRSREENAAAQRVGSNVKGKWHLDALLGLGGMAAVYAATHRNGQRAALKIMHLDLAREPPVVDQFIREAYVANKVGHPAVVRVIDDDLTEADEPFLVMELLDGETVRDLWRRTGRALPMKQALHIAERILDCLAACHGAGIVHRDLKPANVFLTKAGEMKLLDFGVARERESGSAAERSGAGLALGTPAYMSPEQAKGLVDKLDGRSDIFSIGALLHALITGRRIHRGKSEKESLHLAASQPVPPVASIAPELPVEVQRIIDKALAWEPKDRFSDARAMQSAVLSAMSVADRAGTAQTVDDEPLSDDLDDNTPIHEPIERSDPRVLEIGRVVENLMAVLSVGVVHGFRAPEVDSILRTTMSHLTKVLGERGALSIGLRPFGWAAFDHVVHEPDPPLDLVSYRLFDAGVRYLRFLPGINAEELRVFIGLIAESPWDLSAALWERAPAHVRVDSAFAVAEGSVREREAFYDEALALEVRIARRTHAARREGAEEASPLAPDDVVRAVYASQIDVDRFVDRFAEVMTTGLLEAARDREVPVVLGALRKCAAEMHADHRYGEAVQLRRSMLDVLARKVPPKDVPKLASALTSAIFGKEALDALLRTVARDRASIAGLDPILTDLPEGELPVVMAALRRPMHDALGKTLSVWLSKRLGPEDAANAMAAVPSSPPPFGESSLGARDASATADAAVVAAMGELVLRCEKGELVTAGFQSALGVLLRALATRGPAPLEVLFTHRTVFLDKRVMLGTRAMHEQAGHLGATLARCGGALLELDPGVDEADLRAFADSVTAALRKDDGSFSCTSKRIRLLSVSDVLRTRGVDVERLAPEPRAARAIAAAIVACRRYQKLLGQRQYAMPRALRRAAQGIAALFPLPAWLLASLLDPDGGDDAAARIVASARLATSMASMLTEDRAQLARIALAAMTLEMGALRSPDATDPERILSSMSLVLAAQGRGAPSALSHAAICFESQWIRSQRSSVYDGVRAPTLHARIVSLARLYCDEIADRAALPPPTPETVVASLSLKVQDPADKVLLRLLVASLGFLPTGTVVKLGSGEVAEVLAANRGTGRGPLVRLVMDENGEEYSDPFEIELAPGDEALRVVKIINVDAWKRGPERRLPSRPPTASGFSSRGPVAYNEPPQAPSPAPMRADAATATPPLVVAPSPGPAAFSINVPSVVPGSVKITPSPAPASNRPAPAAKGDLTTTPLVHMLVYMLDHALTGTVELIEPDATSHLVGFVRGVPVRVRTGRIMAPLGAQLVASGLLHDGDAAEAVSRARSEGIRLGEYLLSRELIARMDLLRALEMQVPRKIEALVNLPLSSTYAFYRDVDLFDDVAEPLEVDPLRVTLAAARAWRDRARLRKTLERVSALVLQLHADAALDLVELDATERAALTELRAQPCTSSELIGRMSAARDTVESLIFVGIVTRQFVIPGQPKPPMGVRPRVRSTNPSPLPDRISSMPLQGAPHSVRAPSVSRAPAGPSPPAPSVRSIPDAPSSVRSIPEAPSSVRSLPAAPSSSPAITGHSTPVPGSGRPQKKISWSDLVASGRPSRPVMQSVRAPSPAPVRQTPRPMRPPLTPKQKEAIEALKRAELALAHKEINGAVRLVKKAQDIDSTVSDVNAFAIWVNALSGALKPQAANAELAIILAEDEGCTRARLYRAKLLKRENKLQEARTEFERVLTEEPENKDAQNELKLLILTMRR